MTPSTLSDRAVSYLRTAVPVVWGSLVGLVLGWLAPHLPGDLGQLLADFLGGEAALTFVVALAIAGWYAAWRRVEKRIPDWLTRIVLGSAAAPSYAPPLDGDQRVALAHAYDTLPPDDPGRSAIDAVLTYQARHVA